MTQFDALIGRAAASLARRRDDEGSTSPSESGALDGLLFMGNPHETVPRALLLDRRLGAVDVLGWQMIRLLANADRTTAFPTYDELEPLLRASAHQRASRKTVARVIAILRLTRWMTLGLKARNTANGRMIGNVYVLHDEPLAPAEALSLDTAYLEYVIGCTRHHHRAVARVAALVRDELAESGVLDVPTRLEIIEQRAKRLRKAEFPMETQASSAQFPTGTQGNSPSFQRKLRQFPGDVSPSSAWKLSQESVGYDAVSDHANPTTVRSYTNRVCKTTARTDAGSPLIWPWPLELTGDERESASFLLTGLPQGVQQAVIDETAGRLEAGKVKNPLGFLHTLAKRAAANAFQPTHFGQGIVSKRQGKATPPDTSNTQASPGSSVPIASPIRPPASTASEPEPLSAETEQARQALFKRLGLRR
nr:STY4528 family pathogenicity island replication protein [uncultured Halomonas sp.]